VAKIYRRYNPTPQNTFQNHAATGQKPTPNISENPNRINSMPKPQSQPQNNTSVPNPRPAHKASNPLKEPSGRKSKDKCPYASLLGLIPHHIYNPDTKKILGVLSSEDLLLIALIFLFLESSEDDNPLMVLALVYILLGEYIDFGDFAF
jgi:hypothetical protein